MNSSPAESIAAEARRESPLWASALRDQPEWEPVFSTLAPQRYALQMTIGQDTYDRLQYAQALLSHTIPTGDVAEVFDRALSISSSNVVALGNSAFAHAFMGEGKTALQLAQRLGVARQTVAKILGRWRRAGWIITGRGKLVLLNRAALRKSSEQFEY